MSWCIKMKLDHRYAEIISTRFDKETRYGKTLLLNKRGISKKEIS